jgi:thiosulfate/3-mercaptopyruvate sulfurtransferase
MNGEVLITPGGLRPHVEDAGWVICDCRFDLEDPQWGRRAYREGHIPGAIYIDLEEDLSAQPTGKNGRHPLPEVDDLTARFARLGIGSEMNVVAYDASGGPYAARLWWSLVYLGHERARVLDGGLPAWKSAGYAIKGGWDHRKPVDFLARPRTEMIADMQEVRLSLDRPNEVLMDARSGERFRGEAEPYDPVAGHIPGALNRYWKDNLDGEGRFLPPETLRRAFEPLLQGRSPDQVISYCGSGVTAAHNLLAMVYSGLIGARIYPGSWSEWSAQTENPLATEAPPRGS